MLLLEHKATGQAQHGAQGKDQTKKEKEGTVTRYVGFIVCSRWLQQLLVLMSQPACAAALVLGCCKLSERRVPVSC